MTREVFTRRGIVQVQILLPILPRLTACPMFRVVIVPN